MLMAVSPSFTVAALIVLAGICLSAKTYFDYRLEKLHASRAALEEAMGDEPYPVDVIEA